MLKATLRNGAIVPLEPVPAEWQEGVRLEVVKEGDAITDIDAWARWMDELCADSPAEEEERMNAAIDEHRSLSKLQIQREMRLPERVDT